MSSSLTDMSLLTLTDVFASFVDVEKLLKHITLLPLDTQVTSTVSAYLWATTSRVWTVAGLSEFQALQDASAQPCHYITCTYNGVHGVLVHLTHGAGLVHSQGVNSHTLTHMPNSSSARMGGIRLLPVRGSLTPPNDTSPRAQ